MNQDQRNQLREQVQKDIARFLSDGKQIQPIPYGRVTDEQQGLSHKQRNAMEKQNKIDQLGLKDFSELPVL